jgi:hypothetical protein
MYYTYGMYGDIIIVVVAIWSSRGFCVCSLHHRDILSIVIKTFKSTVPLVSHYVRFCFAWSAYIFIYTYYIHRGGWASKRMHRNPIHNIFVDTVVSVLFAQFPTPSPPLWQLQALRNADPIRQVQIVGRVADTHGARNCVIRPLLPCRPWNLLGGR